MKCYKNILRKVFIVPPLLILFSCTTPQQTQRLKEGQIINAGSFSVAVPPGENWKVEKVEEEGGIAFSTKKGLLDVTTEGTTILILPDLWNPFDFLSSVDEVADDYRNREEENMIEMGVNKGEYTLQDVKKGITTVDVKKLYFMSYKTTSLKAI